jgi:hypothetical protein
MYIINAQDHPASIIVKLNESKTESSHPQTQEKQPCATDFLSHNSWTEFSELLSFISCNKVSHNNSTGVGMAQI